MFLMCILHAFWNHSREDVSPTKASEIHNMTMQEQPIHIVELYDLRTIVQDLGKELERYRLSIEESAIYAQTNELQQCRTKVKESENAGEKVEVPSDEPSMDSILHDARIDAFSKETMETFAKVLEHSASPLLLPGDEREEAVPLPGWLEWYDELSERNKAKRVLERAVEVACADRGGIERVEANWDKEGGVWWSYACQE